MRQKTEGKVIISGTQFSDLVATLGYPGKGSVLFFETEEGFEVSLVVNHQAKFIFIDRIDIFWKLWKYEVLSSDISGMFSFYL